MHVRCPHCHNPIEVLEDASLSDISCPSCGSSFSLIKSDDTTSYRPNTETIAHFVLKEKLGVGAFGTVWKAHDTELDRTVAIKVPRKGQLDAEETEKFFREARAAAQLRHPNIVSVHEVGRDGDTVYIVSDLVDGLSLSDWLSGQQVTTREAARLCGKIAEALAHAHGQGVIHRDLKPSNVMLDSESEPHIMDFGLAKREVGEITMTMEGQVLGTPAYMSPEQAKGESHQGDRRSDVYSLGVILFELLTGELPFRGNKRMLLHQVIHEEPPSPRKLNSIVPRDLETICLKCLEKEPRRRFETAQELADELQRFLERKPIVSRPITRIERGFRWCRRKPLIAGLLATVSALLLFVATAGVLVSIQQAELRKDAEDATATAVDEAAHAKASEQAEAAARVASEQALAKAEEAESKSQLDNDRARIHAIAAGAAKDEVVISRDELRRNLYYADLGLAHQALIDADVIRVDQLLNKYIPTGDETDLRGFEWFYLRHACRRENLAIRRLDQASFVRYAPDGETVAVAFKHDIEVFDAATMLHRFTLAAPDQDANIFRLAYSADGRYLAAGLDSGRIICWSLTDRTLKWVQQIDPLNQLTTILGLALSPDGKKLAATGYGKDVLIVDTETGSVSRKISTEDGYVYSTVFLPDGRLVTSQAYGQVVCWNPDSAEVLWATPRVPDHWDHATSLDVSPDGTRMAAAYFRSSVRMLDAANGTVLARLDDHGGTVRDIAYSPDGKYVASSSLDRTIRIRDAETLAPQGTIAVGAYGLAVDFDPSGEYLTSAPLRRWRVADVLGSAFTTENTDGFQFLAISTDGKRFATSDNGSLPLSRITVGLLSDPRERSRLDKVDDFGHLAFRPAADGEQLLLFGSRLELIRINADTGDVLGRFDTSHTGMPTAFAVRLDGKLAATAARDMSIRVWDLASNELLYTLDGFAASAVSLRFAEDGSVLQSLHGDGAIRRWNLESGEASHVVVNGGVSSDSHGAISSDGKLAAFARNYDVLACDAATGEVLMTGKGNANTPQALCFLPDGQTVVSGGADNTVRFWDVTSGQVRLILRDHKSAVLALAVSTDGSKVLSAGRDRTLRIRRADLDPPVTQPVLGVTYSPDGTKIATMGVQDTRGGAAYDCTVQIWDAESRQLLRTLDRDESLSGESQFPLLAFAPDSRHVAVSFDRAIGVWDVETGKIVSAMRDLVARPDTFCFGPEGKTLITADRQEPLMFRDAATGQRSDAASLVASSRVTALAIDPDKHVLACFDIDGTVHLIDLESRTLLKRVKTGLLGVTMVRLVGPNRLLTCGSGGVGLTDLKSGKETAHFSEPLLAQGAQFAISADGETAVCALNNGTDILLRIAADEIRETRRWQNFEYQHSVAISADGATVINGTNAGQVIVGDAAEGNGSDRLAVKDNLAHFQSLTTAKPAANASVTKPAYLKHEFRVEAKEPEELFAMTRDSRAMSVAFSPVDIPLLAAAVGNEVRLWNTSTGHLIKTLTGHDYRIQTIAFSPDGRLLASGGYDRQIRVWNVASGQQVGDFTTDSDVFALQFLPDGKTLVCGRNRPPGFVEFRNMETGRVEKTIITGGNGISRVAVSPARSLLVTTGWGRQSPFYFWNLSTGESVDIPSDIRMVPNGIRIVGFSNDGTLMAFRSKGNTIGIWNFAAGKVQCVVPSKQFASPGSIVFSPSGNEFAVGALPSISIVDVKNGEIRMTRPMRHLLRVTSVAWSRDGKILASAGYEGIVKLWDPTTGELLLRLDQTQVSEDVVSEQPIGEKEATKPAAEKAAKTPTSEATEIKSEPQADNVSVTPEENK